MKNMLIDVLIVDDEAFIREGLKYMIEWEELGFTICDEAENGEEAVEKILLYQPGLVLLDIRIPGMSGTEVIQEARLFFSAAIRSLRMPRRLSSTERSSISPSPLTRGS